MSKQYSSEDTATNLIILFTLSNLIHYQFIRLVSLKEYYKSIY
jgi:hypothetical protein